jgi:hypothetical protein
MDLDLRAERPRQGQTRVWLARFELATARASTPCSICLVYTSSMSAGTNLLAVPGETAVDGRDRPCRELPGLRDDRRTARSTGAAVARYPHVRGAGAVAAAPLPVHRAGLSGAGLHRGPRAGRGQAHHSGGLVGDQLHPTRQCLSRVGGPPARGGLAHRVDGEQAAARRACRRPEPVDRRRHACSDRWHHMDPSP